MGVREILWISAVGSTWTPWCKLCGGAGALFLPVWNRSLYMLLKSHCPFLPLFLADFLLPLRKERGLLVAFRSFESAVFLQ